MGMISTYGKCGMVFCSDSGRRDLGAAINGLTQIFKDLVPAFRPVEQSIARNAPLVKRAESVDVVWRRISR
jgi:hypothetical protein